VVKQLLRLTAAAVPVAVLHVSSCMDDVRQSSTDEAQHDGRPSGLLELDLHRTGAALAAALESAAPDEAVVVSEGPSPEPADVTRFVAAMFDAIRRTELQGIAAEARLSPDGRSAQAAQVLGDAGRDAPFPPGTARVPRPAKN
jgi:hypothetical protein